MKEGILTLFLVISKIFNLLKFPNESGKVPVNWLIVNIAIPSQIINNNDLLYHVIIRPKILQLQKIA